MDHGWLLKTNAIEILLCWQSIQISLALVRPQDDLVIGQELSAQPTLARG